MILLFPSPKGSVNYSKLGQNARDRFPISVAMEVPLKKITVSTGNLRVRDIITSQ